MEVGGSGEFNGGEENGWNLMEIEIIVENGYDTGCVLPIALLLHIELIGIRVFGQMSVTTMNYGNDVMSEF